MLIYQQSGQAMQSIISIQVSIWLAVLGKWNDNDEHFYNLLIEIFIPLKQKSW